MVTEETVYQNGENTQPICLVIRWCRSDKSVGSHSPLTALYIGSSTNFIKTIKNEESNFTLREFF